MSRTQVYLGTEELKLLDQVAKASGATRSEMIRRAVRAMYGERTVDERLAALQRSAGIWKNRRITGAAYVDARRGDLDRRLRRLGLR